MTVGVKSGGWEWWGDGMIIPLGQYSLLSLICMKLVFALTSM